MFAPGVEYSSSREWLAPLSVDFNPCPVASLLNWRDRRTAWYL
jgi:hypothetical protein